MADFFDEFKVQSVQVKDGKIHMRTAGSGPPLLLLHGNPQTHAMWHAVAPTLAESFSVYCPDLRGYGKSFKPAPSGDHAPYSKKQMALDMAELMSHCGHENFYVASHDRGARVAHRLAIDFPARVNKLAVLDIIPTIEHFERTDMQFAMGYYHWFWLAQPHPQPESIINEAPDTWFRAHTSREPKKDDFFHPCALADYLEAVRTPEMITGMCEDYRAAASIDLVHDRDSRESNKLIQCPLLVLWGEKGKIGKWYEPLEIWQNYCANDVTGGPVNSGHYLAEEAPHEVLRSLMNFFGVGAP